MGFALDLRPSGTGITLELPAAPFSAKVAKSTLRKSHEKGTQQSTSGHFSENK